MIHEIYRIFNPSISTEVDQESLVNFILSDENSLKNAGIGIGYVSFYLFVSLYHLILSAAQGITGTLFWLGLAQLGNPSSKRRSGEAEEVGLASEGWLPTGLQRQGEEREELSLTEDVLPSLLTRNSVVQQILINTVLVSADLLLWTSMTYLIYPTLPYLPLTSGFIKGLY